MELERLPFFRLARARRSRARQSPKVVKETTEKCIEIYGQVNAMAISASLARTFAASMAVLTKDLPQKDEKRITNMFFETIVEEMHHLKKEMNESPKELFEIINNNIRPS